jgi:hypothetical protein
LDRLWNAAQGRAKRCQDAAGDHDGGVRRRERGGWAIASKFDYYIDESDPDILVLHRQDRAFAAAFSAQGTTREGIVEAAREDYRRLLEANAESLSLREEGDRQKCSA